MKKSKNNKIKNTSSVFLGWTIASGVVAGLLFFVCMLLGSAAIVGFNVFYLME